MKWRRIGWVFALSAALGFMFKLSSVSATPPVAGQTAPPFTLPSQDGSPVNLEHFRGHWVLLYFYPKDNTAGCTIEAHNFQRDLAKYESLNAVVLGVSLDSQNSHQSFCAKQGLTFRLLSDTGSRVSAQYGSLRNILGLKMAVRNSFLIDPAGTIAKAWLGVSPANHSAQVLTVLKELSLQQSAVAQPSPQ